LPNPRDGLIIGVLGRQGKLPLFRTVREDVGSRAGWGKMMLKLNGGANRKSPWPNL